MRKPLAIEKRNAQSSFACPPDDEAAILALGQKDPRLRTYAGSLVVTHRALGRECYRLRSAGRLTMAEARFALEDLCLPKTAGRRIDSLVELGVWRRVGDLLIHVRWHLCNADQPELTRRAEQRRAYQREWARDKRRRLSTTGKGCHSVSEKDQKKHGLSKVSTPVQCLRPNFGPQRRGWGPLNRPGEPPITPPIAAAVPRSGAVGPRNICAAVIAGELGEAHRLALAMEQGELPLPFAKGAELTSGMVRARTAKVDQAFLQELADTHRIPGFNHGAALARGFDRDTARTAFEAGSQAQAMASAGLRTPLYNAAGYVFRAMERLTAQRGRARSRDFSHMG